MDIFSNRIHIENWELYQGDHFKYWSGTMPKSNDPNRDIIISQLKRAFISANVIKETVDRHVGAILGNAPAVRVSPLEGEETDASLPEIEKILNKWIKTITSIGFQEIDDDVSPFSKAVTRAIVTGRGYLRLFIRHKFVESPDLLKHVSLHSPDNGQIYMHYDDEGSLEHIDYTFSNGKVERQTLNQATGILNFQIFKTVGDNVPEEEYEVDLNFNWSVFEIAMPPMVTSSVKEQQASINLCLTMMGRNIVQAGFLERLILNAQPPGQYIENPNGELNFIPDPNGFTTGAGVTNMLTGIPLGDPRMPDGYTNPSAVFREPVSPATFLESLDGFLARLYTEMGQGHILAQADGALNGVSRIQLQNDFRNILRRQKDVIEAAINTCYYVALAMLSYEGMPLSPDFKNFIVLTELTLKDHLLTSDERSQIREDFKAGLISHQTALEQMDVMEPLEEIDRIQAQREEEMKILAPSLNDIVGGSPRTTNINRNGGRTNRNSSPTSSPRTSN